MSSELEPGVEVPGGLVVPCVPTVPVITHFKEEDEDVHRCGRCQAEFTSLEEFVQHKIQKVCQQNTEQSLESSTSTLSSQEVVPCIEVDNGDISHVTVETTPLQEDMSTDPDVETTEEVKTDGGDDRMVENHKSIIQELEVEWQEAAQLQAQIEEANLVKMIVDEKGRIVCQICEKTFKNCSILKAHMLTHSTQKDFQCTICGDSFRTKGSLIRHIRRHTDERPYSCSKCGKSFRESGALSRHMRSLTPCTEKLSHVLGSRVVVKRDDNSSVVVSTDVTSHLGTDEMDGSPVIQLVTDDKGNLLHEIHVQVRAVAFQTGIGGIINKDLESYKCHQCGAVCKSSSSLKVHQKGHEGCKLFSCDQCGREFLKPHLLKKHLESHGNVRKYKCGECGKLYKTIAHVKGHMRVHSDDRPFPCPKCGKRYKTKNAVHVHLRTHMDDKPYVCQYCPHSFREKGSLVRHIRHHTGEKPYKCPRCGRGFAEHGTLNRHMRTKGGCVAIQSAEQTDHTATENSNSSEAMSSTAASEVASEEPHTMLVQFSSMVADTQEYIIETSEEMETSEAAELLETTEAEEVDGHILNVVQQLVSPGQQIIVQNVTLDDITEPCIEEVPTTDTITIATPESLTEQVALTLASAIGDGTVITNDVSPVEEVIVPEDVALVEQVGEFVITSHEGEVEVQTVIV